jgi:hypothetical protein
MLWARQRNKPARNLCQQWWRVRKSHATKPRGWHGLCHPEPLRLDKENVRIREAEVERLQFIAHIHALYDHRIAAGNKAAHNQSSEWRKPKIPKSKARPLLLFSLLLLYTYTCGRISHNRVFETEKKIGRYELGEIKVSKSFSRMRLKAAIWFVAGFLCSPVVIGVWKAHFVIPVQHQQRYEAYAFFYRTMAELFEGTYSAESGSVREDALGDYKKYADRLGGMCQVHLGKDSAGSFVGQAFFPSGDIFDVAVVRSSGRLYLTLFLPRNWKPLWAETLDRYGVSHPKPRPVEPSMVSGTNH